MKTSKNIVFTQANNDFTSITKFRSRSGLLAVLSLSVRADFR
jgi:hypothetical protein